MKKQSFIKGVLLLTAAGIIVKFLGFAYRVILTNLPGYGDEGNGIYGAGYQVYLILYALSTTGFPAAISKLVAEKMAVGDWRGAHRIFKLSFWLLFCSGGILSLVLFLGAGRIAQWISNTQTTYTLLALSPTIFFVSIMAVFRGYFQGMQDMGPQAGSQIIEQLGKAAATIILAYLLLPRGVELAAAGATAGTTVGAAIGVIYLGLLYNRRKKELWKNIRSFNKRSKRESTLTIIKNLLKISLPVSLGAVILTASNIIDLTTVMGILRKTGMDGRRANELYGILTGKCYVLTHFPVAVTMALATSLVPAVAGAVASKSFRTASEKIAASLKLTVLIGLPSSVGMAILADPILKTLFPGSSEGAELLALSATSIIFVGLTQTLSGVLQGLGKAYIPTLSLLMGAGIKLVLNFTLIPMSHINIKGAIYGTLACYALASAFNIVALKYNYKLHLNLPNLIIKPAVAVIVMGGCTYFSFNTVLRASGSMIASTGASIGISAAVFGFVILTLGGVSTREILALPFGNTIARLLGRWGLLQAK